MSASVIQALIGVIASLGVLAISVWVTYRAWSKKDDAMSEEEKRQDWDDTQW